MRALLCERHGGPEDLVLRDIPDAADPGPGQIRMRVAAAGVNFPDSLIIANRYQVQPPLPFVPGGEAAGIVDAVGTGVTRFRPGQRVAAITLHGAFADQVVVDAVKVVDIPDAMSFDIAAGFTMAYGTAAHALIQRGALRAGETVLVLGASGGVGLAAVEIARAMGARVIAAASSAEKLALACAHGADEGIDYSRESLRDRIRELTDGRGVDVIYDPVGGALVDPAFRSIARNGRYLVIGFAGGDTVPTLPLNLPLLKSAALVGVFWGAFIVAEPEVNRANVAQLYRWFEEGALRPEISRTFPLAEGAAAIRWLMDRKAMGKLVVRITGDVQL